MTEGIGDVGVQAGGQPDGNTGGSSGAGATEGTGSAVPNTGVATAGSSTAGDSGGVPGQIGSIHGRGTQDPTPKIEGKWFESLPEELKKNERITKFESQEAALKAFAEAKLAQEVPSEYTLPKGLPKEWGEWAKSRNLSQEGLDSVLAAVSGIEKARMKDRDTRYNSGLTELFNSWGEKKDEKIQQANRVFKAVPSGVKALELIKASKEGNNPVIVEFLSDIGSMLREGGFLRPGQSQGHIPAEVAHLLFENDVPGKQAN